MQMHKLFHVLVVGGAMMTGSSVVALQTSQSLETLESAPALSNSILEDEELKPIFCTEEGACVVGTDGTKKVKDGFVCCWNTTCE